MARRCRQSPDDLRGEALLGVALALDRDTGEYTDEEFGHYACRRATGAVLDYLRRCDPLTRDERAKARRGGVVPDRRMVELHDDMFASDDPSPEELADRACELRRAVAAFDALNPRERQLLELYYVDEMTLDAAASVLGVTESRACQIRLEALGKLQRKLEVPRDRSKN